MTLSDEEKRILETFCQYGDLANAKLIFVGMEEGLGGNNAEVEVLARRELFLNPIFDSNRIFINGQDFEEGWYIDDSSCLIKAQALAQGGAIANLNLTPDNSKSQPMQNQARMHWLLQGENRTNDYQPYKNEDFIHYEYLHMPRSENAMIDVLPFPNQGELAAVYQNLFDNREIYEKYYNLKDSPRMRVIKYLYNHYPLPLSISYSGYKLGVFKLKDFFEKQLGFEFEKIKDTSKVNPKLLNTPITASENPRNFIIGRRVQDGSVQKAVLTTFWGTGQIARNDIDVISTWL